jgi:predicted nucleotidyltransferase component of viral defense system
MSKKQPSDIASSIKDRLSAHAKAEGEDFNYVLTRYASYRLLYRLSKSDYKKRFILKGATLFSVWKNGEAHRATQDLDLLGYGNNEVEELIEVFKKICCQECQEDGLSFSPESVKGDKIKEGEEYEGVKVTLWANLEGTRIKVEVEIDIGFGDTVTPAAVEMELPIFGFLNLPLASLRTYRQETLVAEKFQAMVSLGIMNSRLKDFYDIWYLSKTFEFQGALLCKAIKATFEQRNTPLPIKEPFAFTDDFAKDPDKQKQWTTFLKTTKPKLKNPILSEVIAEIRSFIMPPSSAAAQQKEFNQHWCLEKTWYLAEPNGS